MTANDTSPPSRSAGLLFPIAFVFLPFAAGYFLSYVYRAVYAVLSDDLVAELGLTAADLGLLTAAFFLTFATFQIPLGLLLDRFGPRRVQAGLRVVAAAGAGVFALGQDATSLLIGRALIGLGMSGGLMASFKAITQWFPTRHWPLVNGWFLGVGGLGAIAATAPVEAALALIGWRGVFWVLAGATALVAVTIALITPDKPEPPSGGGIIAQLRGVAAIMADPVFLRVAPITVTGLASGLAIQGLWAGPWLVDVAGYDDAGKAQVLLAMAITLTIGFVAAGWLAGVLERRGVPLAVFMALGSLVFVAVQVPIVFELAVTAWWPWLVFGLVSNMGVLTYPILSRHFPPSHAGRANTALNLLVFSGAFAAQWVVGAVIGLFPLTAEGGFAAVGYQAGFGLLLALQAVSLIWFAVWRERTAGATGS